MHGCVLRTFIEVVCSHIPFRSAGSVRVGRFRGEIPPGWRLSNAGARGGNRVVIRIPSRFYRRSFPQTRLGRWLASGGDGPFIRRSVPAARTRDPDPYFAPGSSSSGVREIRSNGRLEQGKGPEVPLRALARVDSEPFRLAVKSRIKAPRTKEEGGPPR